MEYTIRELRKNEYPVLDDFLYEAIFIPEGFSAPPRDVIACDALQVYVKDFGQQRDDKCFVAVSSERIVGAVWTRIMDDFGHIDDQTPSFAISLYKEYRGYGIGTALMKRMLTHLKDFGYQQCSLSCQKANYAVKMYAKLGFEVVKENEEEYIMACRLH